MEDIMTSTIRDTDIEIVQVGFGARHGSSVRYILTTTTQVRRCANLAEAMQARADLTDERAGAARVGDIVRIGRGKVRYEVRSILPWGELSLRAEGAETTSVRYVTPERLHVIEAVR